MKNTQNYDELTLKHGNRTRRILMFRLQKPDYLGELSASLEKARSTLTYHLAALQEDGLVEQVDEVNRKKYYQLTADGREVIRRMNEPRAT